MYPLLISNLETTCIHIKDPVPAPAVEIPNANPFLSLNQCVSVVAIGMVVKQVSPIPTIMAMQ